jgi:hypothetical protein
MNADQPAPIQLDALKDQAPSGPWPVAENLAALCDRSRKVRSARHQTSPLRPRDGYEYRKTRRSRRSRPERSGAESVSGVVSIETSVATPRRTRSKILNSIID